MRLPDAAHTSQPWRIHELTPEFRLEDVWALPTPGGPDDFPLLLEQVRAFDPERTTTPAVRALFALRWKLGALLGWDRRGAGLQRRVASLRERLPADLRDSRPADAGMHAFSPLYVTDREWAAELANATVHGVLHLGWVADPRCGHRGQMAVLVKPNGLLGQAYMAAIRPLRHVLVYPAMLAAIERAWKRGAAEGAADAAAPPRPTRRAAPR